MDEILGELRSLVQEATDAQNARDRIVAETTLVLGASDMAELVLGARKVRNRLFGPRLFGEPAWDILLELYIAHHRGNLINVSAAVTFGDTAPTTGLRWLAVLERENLIERRDDPDDLRRQFVALNDAAVVQMDQYIAAFSTWAATKARVRKL